MEFANLFVYLCGKIDVRPARTAALMSKKTITNFMNNLIELKKTNDVGQIFSAFELRGDRFHREWSELTEDIFSVLDNLGNDMHRDIIAKAGKKCSLSEKQIWVLAFGFNNLPLEEVENFWAFEYEESF